MTSDIVLHVDPSTLKDAAGILTQKKFASIVFFILRRSGHKKPMLRGIARAETFIEGELFMDGLCERLH